MKAVEEMLLLRMDLSNEARRQGLPFPYITPTPPSCFLTFPPKYTTGTQVLASNFAFKGTQTKKASVTPTSILPNIQSLWPAKHL